MGGDSSKQTRKDDSPFSEEEDAALNAFYASVISADEDNCFTAIKRHLHRLSYLQLSILYRELLLASVSETGDPVPHVPTLEGVNTVIAAYLKSGSHSAQMAVILEGYAKDAEATQATPTPTPTTTPTTLTESTLYCVLEDAFLLAVDLTAASLASPSAGGGGDDESNTFPEEGVEGDAGEGEGERETDNNASGEDEGSATVDAPPVQVDAATEASLRAMAAGIVAAVNGGDEPPQPTEEGDAGDKGKASGGVVAIAELVHWFCANTPTIFEPYFAYLAAEVLGASKEAEAGWVPSLFDSAICGESLVDQWKLGLVMSNAKTVLTATPLNILYSTGKDGFGLDRFSTVIFGYKYPTLMVVRDFSGAVFGAYVESEWKSSQKFGGTHDAFLFRINPTFAVYKPCGINTNYVFYNKGEGRNNKQPPGIGFGGQLGFFRLFIDDLFTSGSSHEDGTTFASGPVSGTAEFQIENIEFIGCGGDEAVKAQANKQATRERMRAQHRKVDRARMVEGGWENSPDRALLGMVGIGNFSAHMQDSGIDQDHKPERET